MGACDSINADGKRQVLNRGKRLNNNKRKPNTDSKITTDLSSSHQMEEEEIEIDPKIEILRKGQKKELQKMIDNYEDDINDYSFGANKTLLLEAVITCPNPVIIDMIMEKGADIDKEEYQTGNTAIFLSAVDLKVDFVRNLLKYKPNLHHRNHNKQDIFDFLEYQLFEIRPKNRKEMTDEEKEKYEEINNMLKDYED